MQLWQASLRPVLCWRRGSSGSFVRHKLNNETRPHDRKAREALRSTRQPSLEASCLCSDAFGYSTLVNGHTRSLPEPQNFWSLALSIRSSTGHRKRSTQAAVHTPSTSTTKTASREAWEPHTTTLLHSHSWSHGRRPRPPLRERPPEQSKCRPITIRVQKNHQRLVRDLQRQR